MTSEGQGVRAAQQGNVELEGTTHDTQRYVNAMGPRGVIGIMTPGPNVNVENEMMNMRPEGVINAIDRYYVPESEDQRERGLGTDHEARRRRTWKTRFAA